MILSIEAGHESMCRCVSVHCSGSKIDENIYFTMFFFLFHFFANDKQDLDCINFNAERTFGSCVKNVI